LHDDEVESIPKANAPCVPPPLCCQRVPQDVSVFNVNVVIRDVNKGGAQMKGKVILEKMFYTPFKRFHCLTVSSIDVTNSLKEEEVT